VINNNLGLISHRFGDKATYSLKLSIKIEAKPLQMETWLLFTAYRKSPAPYSMVRLQTLYDLPFRHNTVRLAYRSAL